VTCEWEYPNHAQTLKNTDEKKPLVPVGQTVFLAVIPEKGIQRSVN
jgi:hypothetical protein